MIICTCFIQEGTIREDVEKHLSDGFDKFTQKYFGEPAQINWIPVPKVSGFSAGKPSSSSVVSVKANSPVEQTVRVALLKEISNFWNSTTGCASDELLVVVADPDKK